MEKQQAATRAKKDRKDTILIARINGKLKAAIARISEIEGSMTAYIERLVKSDLKRRKIDIDS